VTPNVENEPLAHVRHSYEQIFKQALALDLEVTKDGKKIRHIGAVFNGETFEWKGGRDVDKALLELEAFGGAARYVLGHNLFGHDLPLLKGLAPGLKLLSLPVSTPCTCPLSLFPAIPTIGW
jgi:ATP-dependent DNA helicase RecQ